MSTIAEQTGGASVSDDEVREQFLEWLRANLPAEWITAIETNDDALLSQARRQLDQQAFLVKIGEAEKHQQH